MLDIAIAKFFDDEEQYKKAMKVLGRYQSSSINSWETAQDFLTSLDSYESYLLEQAIEHESNINKTKKRFLQDDVSVLLTEILNHTKEKSDKLDSESIQTLIVSYLQELQQGWKPKHRDSNKNDINHKLKLFADTVGNKESKDLKHSDIVTFKSTISQLPKNRSKGRFAEKSIPELLTMDLTENEKLSGSTIKNYANKVSSFIKWMAKNNYCNKGIEKPLSGMKVATKANHEQRPIFTDDQLTSLFHSKQYTNSGHKQPSHYWVPLLALFTGSRQSELCQLYKDDVYQSKGIWVIDINEKADKKIKNNSTARIIPIHNQLLKMGFIEYIDSFTHARIFPDLVKKRDGYGQKLSRWFCGTYLNKRNCNIQNNNESKNPVFHSFRHTAASQLDKRGILAHQVSHVLGHIPGDGNNETTTRYIKPADLPERQSIINKLHYSSIDFSKIRHWKRGYKRFTKT